MPSPTNACTSHAVGLALARDSVRPSFWSSPGIVAAFLTAAAFCLLLFVLRPGYWINDEVKTIRNFAGYSGSTATVPFLIHNNILMGFILAPLYALRRRTST